MKAISLFSDWNLLRWLRLAISIYLIWQGFHLKDNFALFIGSFFLLQAITNTGCCGAGGCELPKEKMSPNKKDTEDIDYTVIKP